ncbi:MAG: uroporphyrinogen decarboxylase [Anaerolineae bacterium]|nr:uroporphyrinogen decarboxylase [Anaerolineae bacterium]
MPLSKRERLERAVAGEEIDRVPVALWRHWPGDDQRAVDLAEATIAFQRQWDFDFIKVTPASSFCVTDYGVQDRWQGNLEGTREYVRHVVQRSLDWTELRVLDPSRGALGRQLEVLRQIKGAFGDDVPFIQTIFSPLAQAKNIAGRELLIEHLRTAPDRLKTGLNTITESTLRFIDAMRRSGVSGIFYAVQHASHTVMSEDEYREFGRPYDLQILGALPDTWWFNMVHLHGQAPMFDLIADYPIQTINWHDRECGLSLAEGKLRFGGAVSGGLGRWNPMHNGTPVEVRTQAREAIEQTHGRRFILSTGCVIMTTTPQSNIRAVREVVEAKP